jgi:hypothetical protein
MPQVSVEPYPAQFVGIPLPFPSLLRVVTYLESFVQFELGIFVIVSESCLFDLATKPSSDLRNRSLAKRPPTPQLVGHWSFGMTLAQRIAAKVRSLKRIVPLLQC